MEEKCQYVKVTRNSGSPGAWFNDKIGLCLKVNLKPKSSKVYRVIGYTCNNYDYVFIDFNFCELIDKKEYEVYWNLYKEDTSYLINLLTKHGIT